MRLTTILQFYHRYRRVPGLIRFGKTRVIPPISVDFKRKVAELMLIEKDNVDIINKPYLSHEEEVAFYSKVERVPYKNDKQLKQEELQEDIERLRPHYKTEDLLEHLNTAKKWE